MTLTFDLLTWISIGIIYSSRDYLPTKFEACGAKRSWVISCTRFGRLTWPLTLTFDLLTLNINRDHLRIKDYLPTKSEAFWAKRSWVISCTRLRDTDIPTDRHTDRPTCATQYAPLSSKGGIIKLCGIGIILLTDLLCRITSYCVSVDLRFGCIFNYKVVFQNVVNLSSLYPPQTKFGGYIGITLSVCPSVRLSVCPE